MLLASTGGQAAKYYWRGLASKADFGSAANWYTLPTGTTGGSQRTTPIDNDVLIFDGSIGATFPAAPTPIIVDASQRIGQLKIVNGATLYLSGPATSNAGSTLDIAGSPGLADNLAIDATSSVTIVASGNTGNRFLIINIGTGSKGLGTVLNLSRA